VVDSEKTMKTFLASCTILAWGLTGVSDSTANYSLVSTVFGAIVGC